MQHVLFALLLPTYVLLPGAPPAQLASRAAQRSRVGRPTTTRRRVVRRHSPRAGAGAGRYCDYVEGETRTAAAAFEALGVSRMVSNLAASSITAPNALQRSAYEPITSGRDCILHAWTAAASRLLSAAPESARCNEPRAAGAGALAVARARLPDPARRRERPRGHWAELGGRCGWRQPQPAARAHQEDAAAADRGDAGAGGRAGIRVEEAEAAARPPHCHREVDEALRVPHLDHTLKPSSRRRTAARCSSSSPRLCTRRRCAAWPPNCSPTRRCCCDSGRRSPPTPTPPMRTARARPPRRRVSARSCRWAQARRVRPRQSRAEARARAAPLRRRAARLCQLAVPRQARLRPAGRRTASWRRRCTAGRSARSVDVMRRLVDGRVRIGGDGDGRARPRHPRPHARSEPRAAD